MTVNKRLPALLEKMSVVWFGKGGFLVNQLLAIRLFSNSIQLFENSSKKNTDHNGQIHCKLTFILSLIKAGQDFKFSLLFPQLFFRSLWFSFLSLPLQWPMDTMGNPTSSLHLTNLLMLPRRNITRLHRTTWNLKSSIKPQLTTWRRTTHLNPRTKWKPRHTTLNHLTCSLKDTTTSMRNPNLTEATQLIESHLYPPTIKSKIFSLFSNPSNFSDQVHFYIYINLKYHAEINYFCWHNYRWIILRNWINCIMTPLMSTFYSVLLNVAGLRLQFSMSFFNQYRESQIFH